VAPGAPALHSELGPLGFLVGAWYGNGAGSYPGSGPFEYDEELMFTHSGKPVLAYSMRTSTRIGKAPSHAENGFLRCRDGSAIDWVAAHATGHVEVSSGSVVGTSVEIATVSVSGWQQAKEVLALSRQFILEGDLLVDRLQMRAVGKDLQAHVVAELRRA
jgi:THAP4-like, heme-binding beta-barrel domain